MKPTTFALVSSLGEFNADTSHTSSDPRFVDGPWFQLAVSGEYYSPQYGQFDITTEMLATMVDNFKTRTPKAPTELPIDFDHMSDPDKQRTPGDGRAAGWFKALELRAKGTELWAKPVWTKRAAAMLAHGEYRFCSPYFVLDFLDKTSGQKIGPTLRAAAITNRPFLEGMQPIDAPAIAASDRTAVMTTLGRVRNMVVPAGRRVVGLALHEQTSQQTTAALGESFDMLSPDRNTALDISAREEGSMPVDAPVLDTAVVVAPAVAVVLSGEVQGDLLAPAPGALCDDKKMAEVPPTQHPEPDGDEGDLILACPHCGAPVRMVYNAPAGEGDAMTDKVKGLAKGIPKENPPIANAATPDAHAPVAAPVPQAVAPAPPGTPTAPAPAPAAHAAPPPAVVPPKPNPFQKKEVAASEVVPVDAVALAEENATLKQQIHEQNVATALDRAKRAGKLSPALIGSTEKPGWARTFALNDLDGFKTWVENAPVIVRLDEIGSSDVIETAGSGDAQARLDASVKQRMETDKSLSYGEALKQVYADPAMRALAEQVDTDTTGIALAEQPEEY